MTSLRSSDTTVREDRIVKSLVENKKINDVMLLHVVFVLVSFFVFFVWFVLWYIQYSMIDDWKHSVFFSSIRLYLVQYMYLRYIQYAYLRYLVHYIRSNRAWRARSKYAYLLGTCTYT